MFQIPSPLVYQRIHGTIVVSRDWIDLKSEKPLRLTGDDQEVGLYLAGAFEYEPGSKSLPAPDGHVMMTPEVELIDDRGAATTLRPTSFRDEKVLTYRLTDDQKHRVYKSLHLRAEEPMELRAINWTGIVIKRMP